jgi:iron complex outermembrane recepter protein
LSDLNPLRSTSSSISSPPFHRSPIATIAAAIVLFGTHAVHAAQDGAVLVAQAAVPAASAASAPTATPAAPAAAAATSAPSGDTATDAGTDQPRALGTVVVRSRNRIEKLQDVPLSISVVQGAELERLNAYEIGAITKRAANVSWNQGNQRTSSLSIRGVGKMGQTEAQDPSVGTIVDGVNFAYNALTSSFDFVDVEAVEVTRGPQGTLLGKNTSLGVVNITTRRPSFTPSADYSRSRPPPTTR